jgi:uncharacterized membrane protein YkoI
MSEEFLGDRRKALEEEFFAKQNQRLLRQFRETMAVKAKHEALAAASGITDAAVLEQLAAVDLSSETMAALALVPLVEVAWADGTLDAKERSALLAAAEDAGLSQDSASKIALKAVPGKVTDVVMEKKLGKQVYVVEILAQEDGVETDVFVDIATGEVVGTEQ